MSDGPLGRPDTGVKIKIYGR